LTVGLSSAGAAVAEDGELAEPAANVELPPSAERATEEVVDTGTAEVTEVIGDWGWPVLGAVTAGDGSPGTAGSGTAGGAGAGFGCVGTATGGAGAGLGGVGTATGGEGMATGGGGTVTVGTDGIGTVCAAAAPASRQEPTRTVVAAAILMPR
jgi:hypothetical protein